MPGTSSVEEGATRSSSPGAAGFLGLARRRAAQRGRPVQVLATDVVGSTAAAALARAARRSVPRRRPARHGGDRGDGARAPTAVVHLAAVRGKASGRPPARRATTSTSARPSTWCPWPPATGSAGSSTARRTWSTARSRDPDRAALHRGRRPRSRPGLTMYSASKLAAEALLAAFCGDDGPDYVALRFGTIYGPRVNLDSNNGLLRGRARRAGPRGAAAGPVDPRHRARADLRRRRGARRGAGAWRSSRTSGGRSTWSGEPVTAETLYTTLVTLYGGDPATLDWRDERARYQLVGARPAAHRARACEDRDQPGGRADRGHRLVPSDAGGRSR